MGKSISKAFKKVVGGTLGAIGLGAQSAPDIQAAQQVAAPVETPDTKVEDVEDAEQTPAGEKKQKRTGKQSLQVSRSSGGGISL